MKEPILPKKPSEPKKPVQKITEKLSDQIDIWNGLTLKDFLDSFKCKIEDAIDASFCCDFLYGGYRLSYKYDNVKNLSDKAFEKKMKDYEAKMEVYHKKMHEYEIKLYEYILKEAKERDEKLINVLAKRLGKEIVDV